MTKALKLKALILLAVWGMTFAHNVIPHFHQGDCVSGCHELIHDTSPFENDGAGLHKFKSQPEDVKVCHLSGLLFQQFSQDNFCFIYNSELSLQPLVISAPHLFAYTQEFVSDPATGSTSLRAPPVA